MLFFREIMALLMIILTILRKCNICLDNLPVYNFPQTIYPRNMIKSANLAKSNKNSASDGLDQESSEKEE